MTSTRVPTSLVLATLLAVAGCSKPQSDPAVTAVDETIPVAKESEVKRVKLTTTKGDVVLAVHPSWAPKGADRFLELVEAGFYDGVKFFRVIDGFMAQTGIAGDPKLHAQWKDRNIKDDPVLKSNQRGFVSFATSGPDSRSTQFFINFADNSNLDDMGFAPFAEVVEGMSVVDDLYDKYGDGAPYGRGPDQMAIVAKGNEYLEAKFPKLDTIKKASVVESTDA